MSSKFSFIRWDMMLPWLHFVHCPCPGGEDRDSSFTMVERYDPKTNEWATRSHMLRKRAGCGVAVCEGKIYVAGKHDKGLPDYQSFGIYFISFRVKCTRYIFRLCYVNYIF